MKRWPAGGWRGKRRPVGYWPVLALVIVAGVPASARAQSFAQWADSMIGGLAARGRFRGAVLVERDGETLFEKAYGNAVEGWGIANTTATRFEIASLTKQFTGAAILQLAERGKLAVTDAVSKYYADAPATWRGITIQQLLTHTSGLPNNGLDDFPRGIAVPYTADELIRTFRDRPLAFAPGTDWAYTNTEYYLLAYIIEKLSGESYGAYLEHNIFQPLGMTHSGFGSTLAIVPEEAEGYTIQDGVLRHRDYFDRSLEIGAGGIHTTLEDLRVWNHALDDAKVLKPASLTAMFTPYPPGTYGYGWFVEKKPRLRVYHEGGDPGFAAFEARYPGDHVLVVVLANQDDAPVRKIAGDLAARLFGDGGG